MPVSTTETWPGTISAITNADVATDLLTTLTSFGTWEDLTAYHRWDRAGYVHHLTRVIERTLTG